MSTKCANHVWKKKLLKKPRGLVKLKGCFRTGSHPEKRMANVILAEVSWVSLKVRNVSSPPAHLTLKWALLQRTTLLFPFYRWGREAKSSGWGLPAAELWSQDWDPGRLWRLGFIHFRFLGKFAVLGVGSCWAKVHQLKVKWCSSWLGIIYTPEI